MRPEKVKRAMLALRERMVEHILKNDLHFPIDDLNGACGICSFLAFRMLKRMGYRPVFHMNDEHCFVTADGYWIDLTLKQFVGSVGPLYFEDHPYKIQKVSVHKTKRKATSERAIRRLFKPWPDDQNPFKQTIPRLPKTNRLTKARTGVY